MLADWLDSDDVWKNICYQANEGDPADPFGYAQYSPKVWIEKISEPTLLPAINREVHSLFEVARSCIIYGYLCYPLLTLGTEQVHRVAETAVRVRAKEVGWKPGEQTYGERSDLPNFRIAIQHLQKMEVIPLDASRWWEIAVWLRNHASHPTMQTIHLPSTAISTLNDVASRINDLY